MSEQDDQARLAQAQQLVKERRFDEAREILEQMPGNRTAQAWLKKLDDVAGGGQESGAPAPQGGSGRQRPVMQDMQGRVNTDDLKRRADDFLTRTNIDRALAIKVLIISAVSAVLAALIDTILGLPTGALAFTFGWFIVALNGQSYAYYKDRFDIGAVIMAGVAGFLTYEIWFILTSMIVGDPEYEAGHATRAYFEFWSDTVNILKAGLSGIIVGLVGLGWLFLLRRLPSNLIPRR